MKKISLAIICFGFTSLVNAQKVSIGPSMGIGHASLTNTGVAEKKFNPAYRVGIEMIIPMAVHNKVSLGLDYSSEGWKGNYGGYYPYTRTSSVSYIRFTIKDMLYFLKPKRVVRPYLYIGPSVGVKVSEKNSSDLSSSIGSTKSDNYTRIDLGLKGGAGFKINISSNICLNTDIAFYRSIIRSADGRANPGHNNNVSLNLALLFTL